MNAKDELIQQLEKRLKDERLKDCPSPWEVRRLEARIRQLKASVIR